MMQRRGAAGTVASVTVIVVLAFVLGACSASASPTPAEPATPEPSTDPVASRPAEPPTPGPAASHPAATPAEIREDPPRIALTQVGGAFNSPIGIAPAPGGWLLVNERPGRVMALDVASGETLVAVDLTDRVLGSGGEQGLLGFVLHPLWPDVGRAFVHYSDDDGNTVVSELDGTQAGGEAPSFNAGSERVILRVEQPYPNHNGGQLAFGADGYLYLGLGDGGAGGDPHGNGQDPTALLGSILRLDVDGEPYAIPTDNPFADGDGGAPEVFLYGLRNPWRFSFDRATGELWIADVGQGSHEEVSRVDPVADAGANLGWSLMEGSHCFQAGCSPDGLVLPVTEYDHGSGCSVSGGYVYRGAAVEGLWGWYLFGDYCSGRIFGVRSDVDELTGPRVMLETVMSVSAFGESSDGELYVADLNSGGIFRVDPA